MQALTVKVPLNLRNFLIMVLKNAVNAALLSVIQIYHDPADNNFHNWHGIKGILWQIGSAVIAREGVILIPKILKWSQTDLQPISSAIGGSMKSFVLFLLVFFSVLSLNAQTAPATLAPATPAIGQYQIGAGYSSVGGPTDNGTLLTFAKQFSPHVWGQAKGFLLADPSGVTISSVGPRYRRPICAHDSTYFSCTRWLPFVDGNIGAVKDVNGNTKFAYGAGVGLDYQANSTLTLLVGEVDYYRSHFFPTGSILVTNVRTITAGLKISF